MTKTNISSIRWHWMFQKFIKFFKFQSKFFLNSQVPKYTCAEFQNFYIMIPTCYIYIGYEKQRRNTALCWNTCAVCSDDPVTTTTT